jgi:type II secretory pathway pseudopilin PulG
VLTLLQTVVDPSEELYQELTMSASSLFLKWAKQKGSVGLTQIGLTKTMRRSPNSASEQGVTLVECLVAIAALALAGAMIAPPLFVTAATRLQNQRAEQAMQIAQGEIDRVRFLVERGLHIQSRLPATTGAPSLSVTPPPIGFAQYIVSPNGSCPNQFNSSTSPYPTALPANQAMKVDTNGDCIADFMMQVFRTNVPPVLPETATGRPREFDIMVRVYASPAFNLNPDSVNSNLQTAPASLQFTTGEGNQKVRPLAVASTKIYWSDKNFSLCAFQRTRGGCNF